MKYCVKLQYCHGPILSLVGDSVSFSGWGKDAWKSRDKKRSDPQILAATDFNLMMCVIPS